MSYKFRHTIFTPVYNRAKDMKSLYERIKNINYPPSDFEWLIVDDGSTDGLNEYFENVLSKDSTINIRYVAKPNGGIHTAQNEAIRQSRGKYITRIDSDDYLLPEALNIKDRYLIEADNNDAISGVVGICLNASDFSFRSSKLPEDKIVCRGLDLRKQGATGDRNFCIKREIMLQFLLPEFDDTKWVPESNFLWVPLDKEYKTIFVNEPMAVCTEANEGSMIGSLKRKTVSTLKSSLYAQVGLLNHCRFAFSKKQIAVALLKFSYLNQLIKYKQSASQAKSSKTSENKSDAYLLTHRIDRFADKILSPFMSLAVRLKKG